MTEKKYDSQWEVKKCIDTIRIFETSAVTKKQRSRADAVTETRTADAAMQTEHAAVAAEQQDSAEVKEDVPGQEEAAAAPKVAVTKPQERT